MVSRVSRKRSKRSKTTQIFGRDRDQNYDIMLYTAGYDFKTGCTAEDKPSSYGPQAFPGYTGKITKEMNKERKKNIQLNTVLGNFSKNKNS